MNSNFFFKKKKIKINEIFPNLKLKKNFIVENIKPLNLAKEYFLLLFQFHFSPYKNLSYQ